MQHPRTIGGPPSGSPDGFKGIKFNFCHKIPQAQESRSINLRLQIFTLYVRFFWFVGAALDARFVWAISLPAAGLDAVPCPSSG